MGKGRKGFNILKVKPTSIKEISLGCESTIGIYLEETDVSIRN